MKPRHPAGRRRWRACTGPLAGLLAGLYALLLAAGAQAAGLTRFPAPHPSEPPMPALLIYGATDLDQFRPLIEAYQAVYPQAGIDYLEGNSAELQERFLGETAAGARSADLMISSAMDLQTKLVNDGYGLAHTLPDSVRLPEWSIWRREAWAVTYEPIVIVYNRRLVPATEVPQTRQQLAALLDAEAGRYRGRVATYDPTRSGLGYLLATQDARQASTIWTLVAAFGRAQVQLDVNTESLLERVGEGRALIGYNLLGSYALAYAHAHPDLGIVLPRDYTLVISRVAFIPKHTGQPRAAGQFLDWLLGAAGQSAIASRTALYAIHPDARGALTARALQDELGPALRAIPMDPTLLVNLDQSKRRHFLQQWLRTLATGSSAGPSP